MMTSCQNCQTIISCMMKWGIWVDFNNRGRKHEMMTRMMGLHPLTIFDNIFSKEHGRSQRKLLISIGRENMNII